jgi:GxxExxY protein
LREKSNHREGAKSTKGNRIMGEEQLERLATVLVDAAYKVHTSLGPGLLESAYQTCLAHELQRRNIEVHREVPFPVRYDGLTLDAGFRVDLLVANQIIVENKAVNALAPIHQAQLLTYLKLSGLKLGFLINWNVPRIKNGMKRMVNNLENSATPSRTWRLGGQ